MEIRPYVVEQHFGSELVDIEVEIHGLTVFVTARPRPAHCEARENFDQG